MKGVSIDNGTSVDISFHYAFSKVEYNDSQLTPSNMPDYGFDRVESRVKETIRLPMIIGREPREATQMLNLFGG